jgi:arylsulfatase A-like enzyme
VSDGLRRDAVLPAWVLALAMVGTLACGEPSGRGTGGSPERLILIMVDTLRRDYLSCYGSENPTPNIDALAERGQLYTRFKASFHQTSMSMGALFTGRTPSLEFNRLERTLFWNSATWCGLYRFAKKGEEEMCIPPSVPTLAESIRDAGYWTIGITSNQFLYEPSGFSRGFDDWVEVGKKPETAGALARLKLPDASKTRYFGLVNRAALEAVDRRPNDRFFLYVHYMDVHDYGRRGARRYAMAVTGVDWAIGDLLEEFEQRGLLDGAVVIVMSDHGERLEESHAVKGKPGHTGNPSFEEVLEVPLIIAPAIDRDPSAFLRTEDLFFLIQQIAGARSEASPDLAADELFLTEADYRTYLRGRWKSALRRDDGSLTLFDLERDPGETRDVAAEHPDVVEAHRRRVDELGEALSARRAVVERLSEEDRERLQALGYLEQLEKASGDGVDF